MARGRKTPSSDNVFQNKKPTEDDVASQSKSQEKKTTITHKEKEFPNPNKVSLTSARSFDQQVKRVIEESAHGSKAELGKQMLLDQALRISSTQPTTLASKDSAWGINDKSAVSSTAQRFSSSVRQHHTASGRRFRDFSVQAVLSRSKAETPENIIGSSDPRAAVHRRPVRARHSRLSSSVLAGRVVPGKLQYGSKTDGGFKQSATTSTASLLGSNRELKIKSGNSSSVLPKQTPSSIGGSAQIPVGSVVRSSVTGELTASTSSAKESREIPFRPRSFLEGSMQALAGSRMDTVSDSKSATAISEGSRVIDSKTMLRWSKQISSGQKLEVPSKNINASVVFSTEIQNSIPTFESVTNQPKEDSLLEGFSAALKYKRLRQLPHKTDALHAGIEKHLKKHSRETHSQLPGDGIQTASSYLASPSAYLSKYAGQRQPSTKTGLRNSTQRSPSSQPDIEKPKEDSNQIDDSKALQPTESQLQQMLMYCDCSNNEVLGEDEIPEMLFDFDSFERSSESKNVSTTRPKIRPVPRSLFERKDRAARAAFAKELEQMEIAEIEKKQKLKPRRIKKDLKKEGVYQTIKDICNIPDSYAGSLRGNPSFPSIDSGASSAKYSPRPSQYGSEKSESRSSSVFEDKIQLRKDNSLGSKATGAAGLTREDAFHEIELSEESDRAPSSSSSSSCEIISSSSEISLRVNLEKPDSPNKLQKKKVRNEPFVNYHNKINTELILAEEVKSKSKALESNLEGIIIDKIATEFGEWAKENGVKPEAVEKDVIKELFQFGTMDTAANSIAVEIKEIIIVPEIITDGTYPELEERAAIYRQILFDEGAYWRTERSMAFGKPDPHPYKRPPHPPLPTWTKSGFVPQPLATGELLYQTLIDNESMMLERYVLWMVDNPKHFRPPYLIKSGYFQKIVDKHGGSEEAIRCKNASQKSMSALTRTNMAGLNYGMQSDLKKLKDMSEAGKKPKGQESLAVILTKELKA